MTKRIQVNGLQRSGTNFLEELIQFNFKDVEALCKNKTGHWKHSLTIENPSYFDSIDLVLVIAKNPFTWVESISMRNEMDYLTSQTKYELFDYDKLSPNSLGRWNLNLESLCKTYNDFYEFWLHNFDSKRIFIRYEDILEKQYILKLFDQLVSLGLERISNDIVIPQLGSVSESLIEYPEDHLENYKKYVTQHLSNAQRKIIGTTINKSLLKLWYFKF
jgi:hypothetical protein